VTPAYLAALFFSASMVHHLPDGLLSAVCYVETKHDVNAVNFNDGMGDSLGVCEIKLATARLLGYEGSRETLRRPDVNVYWAGAYLHYQLSRYHRNILQAVSAYNSGTYKLKDGKPINQAYIKAVLKAWKEDR
jgi:hypothetical protein